MTTEPTQSAEQLRQADAITGRRLANFCIRNHISRLRLLASAHPDSGRASDPQRMAVRFVPPRNPGKFELVYMAIELTKLVARRVDLTVEEPGSRLAIKDGDRTLYSSEAVDEAVG